MHIFNLPEYKKNAKFTMNTKIFIEFLNIEFNLVLSIFLVIPILSINVVTEKMACLFNILTL